MCDLTLPLITSQAVGSCFLLWYNPHKKMNLTVFHQNLRGCFFVFLYPGASYISLLICTEGGGEYRDETQTARNTHLLMFSALSAQDRWALRLGQAVSFLFDGFK